MRYHPKNCILSTTLVAFIVYFAYNYGIFDQSNYQLNKLAIQNNIISLNNAENSMKDVNDDFKNIQLHQADVEIANEPVIDVMQKILAFDAGGFNSVNKGNV
jgi:hypothetical protein